MQIIINSLIRAAELSLLSIGLSMIFDVLRFPSFAQATFGMVGAYIALVLSVQVGLGLIVGGIIAVVFVGMLGVASDWLIFGRLRGHSPIMLMIASFGLSIAMRNAVNAIWGPNAREFSLPLQVPWHVLGGRMNAVDVGVILASVIFMLGFYVLLNSTNMGIAMRATADDPQLSEASGIITERIIRAVWFIGTGFAALGGIMLGVESQITPNMGQSINLLMFTAAILGGIGSPFGAVLGALIIAFADNIALTINWAPLLHLVGFASGANQIFMSSGYKPLPAFTLLIVILIFRPRGLVGGKSP